MIKQVIPPGGTPANATPAGGWTFATSATAGVTVAPVSGVTAIGTGAINFGLTFPGGVTSTTVTSTETLQAGYTLVQQATKNASCIARDTAGTATNLTVTNVGALGFSVPASSEAAVTCLVYNQAPNPPADITVTKQWVVNGVTYDDGAQPSDLQASLTLNGTAQPWGVTRTGFSAGNTVTVNETTTIGLPLCTLVSRQVTLANGATVNAALPYSAVLAQGSNTYRVTNTVTCTSHLQLVKEINGGPASLNDWTLTALAPTGAIVGPTGTSGINADVTPGARYALSEVGNTTNSALYVQQADPNAVPIPNSTVSWFCVQVDAAGNIIPGFSDGLNGGVTMPLGLRIRCLARNLTTKITVIKQVINDNGGTAVPADFSITVTPVAPVFPGLTPTTVPGSTAGTAVFVRPGQAYTVTETGPAGYSQSAFSCVVTGVGGRSTPLTLTANEEATCTFVNDDQPAHLTLVKTVTNDNGGTAVPTAWTLAAAGPTPISGATGSAAVTNATVNAGTYTLSESGGPAGYTAGTGRAPRER